MMWIDLALIGDEAALDAAIAAMTEEQLNKSLSDLSDALGMDDDELMRGALRILVERVRPLALPTQLWRRPVTASSDPSRMVTEHFKSRDLDATPARVKAALAMYARFGQERDQHLRLSVSDLLKADYRCAHCGLRFYNEELQRRTMTSPLGDRRNRPTDPLKPHWDEDAAEKREPTLDHDWPVSLYGDNGAANLRVLCKGCNEGKEKSIALEHLHPWIGLPARADLLTGARVSFTVFYAQLRRAPCCWKSGRKAMDVELTVELRNAAEAAVIDNLRTIAMV